MISDGLGNKCCMLVRGFAMFTSSIIACAFINWQLTFITFTMGPVSAFVLHLLTKVFLSVFALEFLSLSL